MVFLKKKRKILEDSEDKVNYTIKIIQNACEVSIPRELKKLDLIKKHINFKNKQVLEKLRELAIKNNLRKISKLTVGVDNSIYKKFLEEKGLPFPKDIDTIINKKIKFEYRKKREIEHKHDPILFLKKLKKIVKKDGYIVLRIPNFYNIYMFYQLIHHLKVDGQEHRVFLILLERNLDLIFKKLNFKIYLKKGFNEYSANHLFTYLTLFSNRSALAKSADSELGLARSSISSVSQE